MATLTFNDILDSVAALPDDDQERLVELLRKRRSEKWRRELAAYVQKTRKSVRSGKLKGTSAAEAIAILEADWEKADE